MTCWQPSSRISLAASLALTLLLAAPMLRAQAPEGTLSEKEVEALRDVAFEPTQRIAEYQHILDDRERILHDILTQRRGHAGQADDFHDVLEQIGAIVDELNDNLDEDERNHRDVRKQLPKLIAATERWSTALRTPAPNDAYDVVRRLALDNLKETREIAERLGPALDAYFKEHPEALKLEKARKENPHAPTGDETPPAPHR